MSTRIFRRTRGPIAILAGLLGIFCVGCQHTPINLASGPAWFRTPRPGAPADSFENSLTGGEVFSMYCNQCHNARALAERPFANYQNVAAHMRVRACMTGVEYEKVMEFLRRFHDIPSSTPPVEPSPKKLIFSQPAAELRDQIAPENRPAVPAPPFPGAAAQPLPAPAQGVPEPIPAPAGGGLVPALAPAAPQPAVPGAAN
jgi:hypothetical protein